ncbi:hypothetical protein [Paludisphaera soli]|uniref:hypothetical protein n=1 Tax=Paludisphaera soli TaxID=2712865 RepID=UPI0013EE1BED|nr:hypothetical protein [Paludisphaera soli]
MWTSFSSPRHRHSQRLPGPRRALRPILTTLEGRIVLSVAFDSVLTVGNDTASISLTDSAVDAAGNTYVTGNLQATMDFDPANVRADGSDILSPRGTSDAYVAKYNADNSFAWARSLGGDYVRQSNLDEFEKGNGIRVDGAGNVYVTGTFFGQADFGAFRLTSAGDADAFVAKLDGSGGVVWAKGWGSSEQDVGNDLAVDGAGNVISVGTSAYSDPVKGWIANESQVRKYGPTGAAVWSASFAGPTHGAYGVATDAANNIYVAGRFSGNPDFNPSPKKANYASASGSYSNYGSGYVLKLTSAGAYGWVSAFQTRPTQKTSGSALTIFDIAADAAGDVAVVGNFQGEIDFNPSASVDTRLPDTRLVNGFVVKLTSNGSLAWARHTGGDGAAAVAFDAAGAVYVTGWFSSAAPGFSPGFGLPDTPSHGAADVYLSKYTSAGNLAWAVTFGGAGPDAGHGLSVDASGIIYLAGLWGAGTTDFDPTLQGTQERTNTAFGDLFLLKLRQS